MTTTDRAREVSIPALTSPSLVRWGIATAVGLVGVTVWAVMTQPPSVWGPGVPLMVALLAALTAFAGVSRRLDADGAAVTQVRARVLRRRVALGPGTEVVLVPNGGGSVLLGLQGQGEHRRLHLPLLTADVYGDRMQSAAVFGALADALSRDLPPRDALRWAVHAAALSVGSLGATTGMPTRAQVEASLAGDDVDAGDDGGAGDGRDGTEGDSGGPGATPA